MRPALPSSPPREAIQCRYHPVELIAQPWIHLVYVSEGFCDIEACAHFGGGPERVMKPCSLVPSL